MNNKLVSIIIVTYNREKDIQICLESILNSTYKNYEIVIVDNASTDNTLKILEEKYRDKIKFIKSDKNLMAGGGRNLGAKHSEGKYLLFIDSDNIIDKEMINELIKKIDSLNNAGMVGPLMYFYKDPKRIWWAGSTINLWTSKTTYIGINEIDKNQYNLIRKVSYIPNIFMIKKNIWDKVDGINENYVMHYEESDLAEKIKKIGYKIYMIPTAKTWHNVPVEKNNDFWIRTLGGSENLTRNYLTARNRILFINKNANFLQNLVFLFIFLPLFTIFYLYKILKTGNYKIAYIYLKGTIDGILKT